MDYQQFLDGKTQLPSEGGFKPLFIPDYLFDFQKVLTEWNIRKGRSATFANCGLGKTIMELVWSENVIRKTNKKVLLLTPLSVTHQIVKEGEKFGIESYRTREGDTNTKHKILVTNYEQLHFYNPSDFVGVACDESGILKNCDGATRNAVIEFMRKIPYRMLGTATAAPNDYIELGNSSEALGELGFMDMLGRFFKKTGATSTRADEFRKGVWRFRGHGEKDFWRWICSWARAVRNPSDLGFDDGDFILPELRINEHIIEARTKDPEFLFPMTAMNLEEQRRERRRTIQERCEKAAELAIDNEEPTVIWCHLNDEGNLLQKLIKGSVEVSGKDSDERKEEIFNAFETGEINKLVTKKEIAAWGLNWQHCAHQVGFPSHSFEQHYQSVRRSWRFGQKRPVDIDMVCTEGEVRVLGNLKKKSEAADKMFDSLVEMMNNELKLKHKHNHNNQTKFPLWLQNKK